MATKAAERIARILRIRIHNMDPKDKYTDPAQPDNDKWLRAVCESDAKLIEPELQAIIERCAQIADAPYSDSVQAFGGDEPKAVGMKIAAAIRSMGEQK